MLDTKASFRTWQEPGGSPKRMPWTPVSGAAVRSICLSGQRPPVEINLDRSQRPVTRRAARGAGSAVTAVTKVTLGSPEVARELLAARRCHPER